MQREFSKELAEDRQFEIGGELFEWVYPHWTVMAEWAEEGEQENGDQPAFSLRADTEYALEKIPLLLNPKNDAIKRWKALAARKTDPVPRHQIAQLYVWLIQQASGGLPTSPPSDSGSGGGDSAESSVDGSSSPGETPTE